VTVRIYVEGGGTAPSTNGRCREGFRVFFSKVLVDRPRQHFQIIACGSRNATLDRFGRALREWPDDLVLLLVDAEGPIKPTTQPWAHLQQADGWRRPPACREDQAHLMVECMEAWLVADRVALERFYGQGFRGSALPSHRNVEGIAKQDLVARLKQATNTTAKGIYDKADHSFDLLTRIDPALVRAASPYAERLCALLVAS
jgi:hypothetical protein